MDAPTAKKHGCLKIGLILVGIVLIAFGVLVGMGIHRDRVIDRNLAIVAATQNKKLPVYLDINTRLDSVTAGPGHVLHYHCTVLLWAPNLLHQDVKTFTADMRGGLLENAHKNPVSVQAFSQNGVSLEYDYFDQDATPITQVVLTPDDLK